MGRILTVYGAAFTGIFPSRHSLSHIVNHLIMLIYLTKLPTDCICVFRSVVAADSQHCAVWRSPIGFYSVLCAVRTEISGKVNLRLQMLK